MSCNSRTPSSRCRTDASTSRGSTNIRLPGQGFAGRVRRGLKLCVAGLCAREWDVRAFHARWRRPVRLTACRSLGAPNPTFSCNWRVNSNGRPGPMTYPFLSKFLSGIEPFCPIRKWRPYPSSCPSLRQRRLMKTSRLWLQLEMLTSIRLLASSFDYPVIFRAPEYLHFGKKWQSPFGNVAPQQLANPQTGTVHAVQAEPSSSAAINEDICNRPAVGLAALGIDKPNKCAILASVEYENS